MADAPPIMMTREAPAAALPTTISPYLMLAAILWMAAMTVRLYPQFSDAIRVDGRVTTVAAYLADACGERAGPLATSCRQAAQPRAQHLLRREQAKSILLIEAPVLGYFFLFWPARFFSRRRPAAGAG